MQKNTARWRAVLERNAAALPPFFYAVTTTGIYCRPDCPSRRPLARNVEFFDAVQEAEAAGYRPCKRCQPRGVEPKREMAEKVVMACRAIEEQDEEPSLEELARASGMSPTHFHRAFKAATGVTPKAYARAQRRKRMKTMLQEGQRSITTSLYAAGYSSGSRFYEGATQALGMRPSQYKKGGANTRLLFAVGECSLGAVLVACSRKGVVAILLGDDAEELLQELQSRFFAAELVGGDEHFERLVGRVVAFVDEPRLGLDLPLDIRGTAFQERVWRALQRVPVGTTVSYAQLAEQIGAPKSYRAVAGACAANHLAVAIPCHRVVRSDGGLSGYRWGIERKRRLLEGERGEAGDAPEPD